MNETEAIIKLEHRFDLLREVVASYRIRLEHMEAEVVQWFAANQLSEISRCIQEKQKIMLRIEKLEKFIKKWEANAELTIEH
ncbi:hypothetical protein [Brevibacillus fulvus]|uniref:Uncharacterized protein n=1 Tax=Brevibacillus fulvus TaxID=1125967 RepID=A0A939BVR7_9BACL|nr:hypothetical protein [Brevibacillus fulvus]MBM7590986.1 hypothetical protein [Brevibacillus fulvus]